MIYNVQQLATMNHGDEVPISDWILDKQLFAVAMRVFYLARIVLAPIWIAGASWLLCALGVPLVTGFLLTFVFVVSHNFGGSERSPASLSGPTDFWKMQVETSCSYGGALAGTFTGGLNMQIEHHCMPRLNSWYYPRVQAAVQAVCKKVLTREICFPSHFSHVSFFAQHGVRYVYFPSLWQNVLSTIRYMQFVGETVVSDAAAVETEKAVQQTESLQIVIRGRVLDVSRWAPRHPGGAGVLRVFADRDAAEQFAAMHSPAATKQLEAMLRNSSQPVPASSSAQPAPLAAEYWKLRDQLERDGMFRVPVAFEMFRFASNMFFYIAGFVLMRFTEWHW